MSITIDEMKQELRNHQLDNFISTSSILEKCVALCNRYNHTIPDFLIKLEAFVMNANLTEVSIDTIGQFDQSLYKESRIKSNDIKVIKTSPELSQLGKRTSPSFKTPVENIKSIKPSNSTIDDGNKTIISTTIKKDNQLTQQLGNNNQGKLESSLSNTMGITYMQRPNPGQSVLTLNPHLGVRGEFEPSQAKPLGLRSRLQISEEDFENISTRYRYMFTSLDERARSLDKHLLKLQVQLCDLVAIEESELHPVGVPSQDLVWVCGRICCEASDGRINKSSIVLEGSRRDSAGRRVALEVEEISSYSLFPGQIVLVEGVNSSGRKMVAKRIIEGVVPPALCTSATKLLEYHHSKLYQGGSALNVITAAGPFTTSDKLDYQPLQDLLVKVLEKKPDVLVLIGPFVDITQPLLSSGEVKLPNNPDEEYDANNPGAIEMHEASYELVFVEKIVRDCIQSLFDSEIDFGGPLPTQIILVPSLQDGHHDFVFPQPPFGDHKRIDTQYFQEPLGVLNIPFSKPMDPRKRVHLMPNPCMFRVNEVLFGVCSNDVLFSLSSDEVSRNIEGNRLVRLAGHLLKQQSFSPQFPVPANLLSQYDLRHSKHWEFNVHPDILILPSRLTSLAKEIYGTLIVNPGPLTRGIGGGTYAELNIHPIKENILRDLIIQSNNNNDNNNGSNSKNYNKTDECQHEIYARTSVNIIKI